MKLMRTSGRAMWMGAAACGVISWQAAVVALAIVVVGGALRLFTEWQRRKTFRSLLRGAPEGTIIAQQDGPGGQVMTVTWGNSGKNAIQPPGHHS
jgi:hypothetical protein